MTITNIQTSSAYPGEGVRVTLDKNNAADMEMLSWAYPGMQLTSDASGDKGVIDTVDRAGNSFTVVPIQADLTFMGSEPFKLKPTDTISFNENKIGNLIWKTEDESTTKFLDGTDIPLITNQTQWANNTTGAYCHFLNDPIASPVKIYSRNAVNKKLSTMTNGWRLPYFSDWIDLLKSTGSPFVAGPPNSQLLPYDGRLLLKNNINYKNFNGVNIGNRTNVNFANNVPIWHVNPDKYPLYSWMTSPLYKNFSLIYRVFTAFINSTQYGPTTSAQNTSQYGTYGVGVRLCRDYQENVVITK